MDRLMCPNCGANWRHTGVRESGLVAYHVILRWDHTHGYFEGRPEETQYGDCAHMDWACPQCTHPLDDQPDNLAADTP
jgi:hypothetical protein